MPSLGHSPPRGDRSHPTTSPSCRQSGNGVAALYEQISALQNSLERSRNENIKLRMLLKAHCETKAISVTSRRSSFGDDPFFDYDQPGGLTRATGLHQADLCARHLFLKDSSVRTHASATPLCIASGPVDGTVDAKLPTKRPLAQPRKSRPPVKCQQHVSFEIITNDKMCCAPSPELMDIILVRKKSTHVQTENPGCTSPDMRTANPECRSRHVRPEKLDWTVPTGCF